MINSTFLSLSIISSFAFSPLFSLNMNMQPKFISISSSYFKYSYSNVLYTDTKFHSTFIKNNKFIYFLNSPLFFSNIDGYCVTTTKCCISLDYNYTENQPVKDLIITNESVPGTGASYLKGCGDIQILNCVFTYCTTGRTGAGIYIEQNSEVFFYELIFDNCFAGYEAGGAAISENYDNGKDIQMLKNCTIQYVCINECKANRDFSGIVSSSQTTEVYYESSNSEQQDNAHISENDQFYIKGNTIKYKYANITGGYNYKCGGIEIANSINLDFNFINIFKTCSCYSLCFNTANMLKEENISMANIIECKYQYYNTNPVGIIYYTENITLVNFVFFNNTFSTSCSFIIQQNSNEIVTFINCFADFSNEDNIILDSDAFIEIDCDFTSNSPKIIELDLLNTRECQNSKTPTPSSFFTDSYFFSKSISFSESKIFSASNKFTASNEFTESQVFTPSNTFININTKQITITELQSYSLTFVNRKSVTVSVTYFQSISYSISYINDIVKYSQIYTEIQYVNIIPYVIYYLSPSYVQTNYLVILKKVKTISPENFIGIVCGSFCIFFIVLGAIILTIRKIKYKYRFNDNYDVTYYISDSSNDVVIIKKKTNIYADSSDSYISSQIPESSRNSEDLIIDEYSSIYI